MSKFWVICTFLQHNVLSCWHACTHRRYLPALCAPTIVTYNVNAAYGVVMSNWSICTGVPAFLANVPVLGSALRGVVIRSAQRMIQDIESILGRVNDTTDIHEVLRRAAKKGHAQEADKQAQAQRKEQQKQEAAEQKRSGRGGRFL
jgi:hypothetical protein